MASTTGRTPSSPSQRRPGRRRMPPGAYLHRTTSTLRPSRSTASMQAGPRTSTSSSQLHSPWRFLRRSTNPWAWPSSRPGPAEGFQVRCGRGRRRRRQHGAPRLPRAQNADAPAAAGRPRLTRVAFELLAQGAFPLSEIKKCHLKCKGFQRGREGHFPGAAPAARAANAPSAPALAPPAGPPPRPRASPSGRPVALHPFVHSPYPPLSRLSVRPSVRPPSLPPSRQARRSSRTYPPRVGEPHRPAHVGLLRVEHRGPRRPYRRGPGQRDLVQFQSIANSELWWSNLRATATASASSRGT